MNSSLDKAVGLLTAPSHADQSLHNGHRCHRSPDCYRTISLKQPRTLPEGVNPPHVAHDTASEHLDLKSRVSPKITTTHKHH